MAGPQGLHRLPLNCGFAKSKGAGREKVGGEKKREGIGSMRRREEVGWRREITVNFCCCSFLYLFL